MNKTSSKSIFKIALLVVILALVFATMTACGGSSGGGEEGQDNDVSSLISLDSISGIQNATIDTGNKKVTANVSYEVTSLAASDLSFAVDAVAVEIYEDSKLTRRVSGDTVSLSVGQNTFYVYAYLPNRKNVNVTYEFVITRSANDGTTEGEVVAEKIAFELESISTVVTGSQYVAPRASDITPEQVKTVLESNIGDLIAYIGLDAEEKEAAYKEIASMLIYAGVDSAKLTQVMTIIGNAIDEIGIVEWLQVASELESLEDVLGDIVTAENVKIAINAMGDISELYDVNTLIALSEYALSLVSEGWYAQSSNSPTDNMTYDEIVSLLEDNGVDASMLDVYGFFNLQIAKKLFKVLQSDNGVYVIKQLMNAEKAVFAYDEAKRNSMIETLVPIVVSLMTEDGTESVFAAVMQNSLRDLVGAVNTIGKIVLASIDAMGDEQTLSAAYLGVVTQCCQETGVTLPVSAAFIVSFVSNVEIQKAFFHAIANVTLGEIVSIYDDIQTISKSRNDEKSIAIAQLAKDVLAIVEDEWEALSADRKEAIDKAFRTVGIRSAVEKAGTLIDELKNAESNEELLKAFNDMKDAFTSEMNSAKLSILGDYLYITEETTKEELIEVLFQSIKKEYGEDEIEEGELEELSYKVKSILGTPYLEVTDRDGKIVGINEKVCLTKKADHYRLVINDSIVAIRTPLNTRIDSQLIRYALYEDSIIIYNWDEYVGAAWEYTIDLSRIIPTQTGLFAATMTINAEMGGVTISQEVPFVYYVYDPNDLKVLELGAIADFGCVVGDTEEQVRNALSVRALCDDGESYEVVDYQFSSFDSTQEGEVEILIAYGGKECTVPVYFYATREIVDLACSTNDVLPGMTEEEFREKLTVEVCYNTGERVAVEEYELVDYVAIANTEEQTVTVVYEDFTKEVTFTIDVTEYRKMILMEMITDLASFYDDVLDRIADAVENETSAKIALSGSVDSSSIGVGGLVAVLNVAKENSSARISLLTDTEETEIARYVGGRLKVGDVGMDVSALSENIDEVLWAALTHIADATDGIGLENTFVSLLSDPIGNMLSNVFIISKDGDEYSVFIKREIVSTLLSFLNGTSITAGIEQNQGIIDIFFGEGTVEKLKTGYISMEIIWNSADKELSIEFVDEQADEFFKVAVIAMEATGVFDEELESEIFTIEPIEDEDLKDIVLTIPVEMPQKALTATATVTIHTSDMFQAEGNDIMTIIVTVNNVERAIEFVLNDGWEYVDITRLLYESLGGSSSRSTSFYGKFIEDGEEESLIVRGLNNALSNLAEELAQPKGYNGNASMCDVPYDENGEMDPYYRKKLFPLYERDMTKEEFLIKLIAEVTKVWSQYADDFVVYTDKQEEIFEILLRITDTNTEEKSIFDLIGLFVYLPENDTNWNNMIAFNDIPNLLSIFDRSVVKRFDKNESAIKGLFGVDYTTILNDLYVDVVIDTEEKSLAVDFCSQDKTLYYCTEIVFDVTSEDTHFTVTDEMIENAEDFRDAVRELDQSECYEYYFRYEGKNVYAYSDIELLELEFADAFLGYPHY